VLGGGGGQATPTTDTNGLGHCDTGTDACGASEASDSAGHFGRALQTSGHLLPSAAKPMISHRVDGLAVRPRTRCEPYLADALKRMRSAGTEASASGELLAQHCQLGEQLLSNVY
jgi:hypothetical protein